MRLLAALLLSLTALGWADHDDDDDNGPNMFACNYNKKPWKEMSQGQKKLHTLRLLKYDTVESGAHVVRTAVVFMAPKSDPLYGIQFRSKFTKKSWYESESEESEMSECGLEVLSESPEAYEQCFEGGPGHFGACETCGYYYDVSDSDGAYDCITCADGWEIDVVFGDCTGHCVEAGTAVIPVIGSGCEPVSECVLGDQHGGPRGKPEDRHLHIVKSSVYYSTNTDAVNRLHKFDSAQDMENFGRGLWMQYNDDYGEYDDLFNDLPYYENDYTFYYVEGEHTPADFESYYKARVELWRPDSDGNLRVDACHRAKWYSD
jgi:hypothetical protein